MSSWSTARRAMCSGSVTRLASSALGLALWIGVAAAEHTVRVVGQSSALAGFGHHAATEGGDELRVGDALVLDPLARNPRDTNAASHPGTGRHRVDGPVRGNSAQAGSQTC